MDAGIVTTIALAGVSGVAIITNWAFEQKSRIDVLTAAVTGQKKQADERHSDIKEDLKLIRQRLGVYREED